MMNIRFAAMLSFVTVLFLGLSACDPVPRRTLSLEEKQADLLWVYSQFGQNYAPLQYKEARLGKSFINLKQQYLKDAEATQTNEEFYGLMLRFISEFADAHTSGSLTQSGLPGRVQIAYLGFTGKREKDALLVMSMLPTMKSDVFPVQVGDKIMKIDGVLVMDRALELAKYRDLGRTESNITFHMNKLFTRVSTMNGIPSAANVTLTVLRGDQSFDVLLPWIVKDIVQFEVEQDAAKEKDGEKKADTGRYRLVNGGVPSEYLLNLISFNGRIESPTEVLAKISRSTREFVTDGFRLVDAYAGWAVGTVGAETPKTPEEVLKAQRNVPEGAVFLTSAKTFPAYVSREKEGDREALVGTIYVDTFSPSTDSNEVMTEWKQTLAALQQLGVKHVVLDLINNGGGSLELGMKMAQAMSAQPIVQPTIQFRLSDSWLDSFESGARQGPTNSDRELSRRVLSDMNVDQKQGQWLSRPYPLEVLMAYQLKSNPQIKTPFQVAVLVNEMCASMCDIFSAVVQDNGLGVIVGSNSMGAGGNVVSYNQTPNSHMDLRQTESLIFRKDGSAIENNGVMPDVSVTVSDYTSEKYDTVRKEAVKALLQKL